MPTLADALERAQRDARFRAKLLSNPEAALSELGLPASAWCDLGSMAETVDLDPNAVTLSDDINTTRPLQVRRPRKANG